MIKHQDTSFENQTIFASGQAFLRCSFIRCTLVIRDSNTSIESCNFEHCNFHLDMTLLSGVGESWNMAKNIIGLLERQASTDVQPSARIEPDGKPVTPMQPPKLNGVARSPSHA